MKLSRAWMVFEALKALPFARGGPLVSPRLGWGIAALVVILWTALCAAVYGLVLLIGNWAVTGASYGAAWNVEWVEFITSTLSLLQGVGHVVLAVVWAMVSVAILGITWFLTAFKFKRAL